jgi:hypothetical protein
VRTCCRRHESSSSSRSLPWMDGRTDGWQDGRRDGWMERMTTQGYYISRHGC